MLQFLCANSKTNLPQLTIVKKFVIHLFLSIILFLFAVILISPLVFLGSDVGLRYLQIKNLITQNWQTFAIDYPAALIDPDLEFVPYYYAYSVIDHQIFLSISPYLPLFSSILFKIMGIAGLAVIPVLGAIFTGWAVKKIFNLHDLPYPDLMFWLTILATPILFYSLQIWDHTIGVAFSTWAVYFAAKGIKHNNKYDFLWVGVLLGLGLGQRPELYVFAIAITIGILIASKTKFMHLAYYFIGGVIGVIPIWITQYLWSGHPLGIIMGRQLLGYGEPENYPFAPTQRLEFPRHTKIGLFLYDIDQTQPVLNVLVLFLLLIGLYLLILAFKKRQKLSLLYIGLSMFLLAYVISLFANPGQTIQGLLSTFPLIALSLIWIPQKDADDPQIWRGYQLIGVTSLIFLAIMVFIWPADGGLQWGARYLLPVYPLLFYMAIFTFHRLNQDLNNQWQKALQITTVALLIVSIALQMMSVYTLLYYYKIKGDARNIVENLPAQYILTNAPYLPSDLTATDKTFLYVDNSEILTVVLNRMASQGSYDFAVIPPLAQIELRIPDRITGYRIEKISEMVYRLHKD